MRPNDLTTFWKNVNKSDEKGCWTWNLAKDRQGYGFFWYKNKQIRAHRFVVKYVLGLDIENLLVCHTCDNPCCVRPDHLFVGTVKDNTRDMLNKGRGLLGRKRSPESIAKSAASRRGKKWTDEMRKRASIIRKGRKASEAARKKMSIAQTGRKHSEETKLKISRANTGKKLSDLAKAKMRDAWVLRKLRNKEIPERSE